MISISFFSHILEQWNVMEYLETCLNHGVTKVVMASILTFYLLPWMLLIFGFLSALLFAIYHRKSKQKTKRSDDFWDDARQTWAYLYDLYARIWHGYELHGLENIPEGPGVVIFYHGAIPVDYVFFVVRYFILTHRMCVSVVDHILHKLPGFKLLLEFLKVPHGTREDCMIALKNGELVGIAPGGAREAFFSDQTYKVVWGHRKGFAHLAIDAKVGLGHVPSFGGSNGGCAGGESDLAGPQMPVIPMFTENIREAYRAPKERKLSRWLYDTYRLPVLILYGGLPVKFRTYIGEPIPYDPNVTAEELAEKTKTALQNLIQRHQQIPGSMWKALLARFD